MVIDKVCGIAGSQHSSWKLQWKNNIINNSKIDNSIDLQMECQLYDSYNQTITYIANPIIFQVEVDDTYTELFVTGTHSHSFNNSGYSLLKFKIEKYNVTIDDNDKNWNIFVSLTASNVYTQTYLLQYSLNFSTISNVFFGISTTLFILTLIAIICTFCLTHYFRKTAIIRKTNNYLMYFILLGLAMLLLSLYLFTTNVTSSSCILSFILLHFGVLFIIGPLGGKTFVLYKIFSNKTLKKLKRISPGWLILWSVICPAIIVVIYLIFWIIFDLNENNFHSVIIEFNNNNSYQQMCSFNDTFIYITLSMIIQ